MTKKTLTYSAFQIKNPLKRLFSSVLTTTIVLSGFTSVEAKQSSKISTAKATVSQTAPKWKVFTAPDGGFTVLMPGNPKMTSQTQKTFMGEINLQVFVAQPPKQEVAYVVAFNDFPDSYGKMANPDEVLKNAQAMALKTTQSELINERNIRSSNGQPGREIEYINRGGKITKSRMYFAEGRLYQVMVITTKRQQKYLLKSIAGYLNSFNVVLRK